MGRCHEFGSQIREGCGHPMQAGERACACPQCGVVCEGLFDGCPAVWDRGPRPVPFVAAAAPAGRPRALSAGPAFDEPAPPPPPRPESPLVNGFSGPPPNQQPPQARRAVPPPLPSPPAAGADARADVLRWFEDAFDELRNELHAVVSTVTRQQAMLTELLDSREAELRVVVAAESLPELAGEAAAKALGDQTAGLAEFLDARLEELQTASDASDQAAIATMDAVRELVRRVEVSAELNGEALYEEGAVRLEALKASVTRQLRPVVAAVSEIADHVEGAQEREASRARALRASVTKALQPLVEASERSEIEMAEIRQRLDALAAAISAAGPPAPAPAKRSTRPRAARRPPS